MIIYFVRHGFPNYETDKLTELGKKQAAAAAERLREAGIEKIFASTSGRAIETAEYTAKMLGLDITTCEFMRELSWRLADGGQLDRIETVKSHVEKGISLSCANWQELEPYQGGKTVETAERVTSGFDAWLSELGYEREGEYYRVVGDDTDKVVAMFSHVGSSTVALSRLFNIPFPKLVGMFNLNFTSITAVSFSNEKGRLIHPEIIVLNDARHIKGL